MSAYSLEFGASVECFGSFFCLFLPSKVAGSKSARLREWPFEVAVTKPLLIADGRMISSFGLTVLIVMDNIRQIG